MRVMASIPNVKRFRPFCPTCNENFTLMAVLPKDANVEVLAVDVQAPGNPLLRLVTIRVDGERGLVRANLLGFIGHGLAVYRDGSGCAVVPDGNIARAKSFALVMPAVQTGW